MAEYIERKKVVDAIADTMANGFVEDRFITPQELQKLQDELEMIPAVDVVPVVRCKDCKYYSLCGRPPFMFYQCTIQGATRSVDKDDFCKHGVLRE